MRVHNTPTVFLEQAAFVPTPITSNGHLRCCLTGNNVAPLTINDGMQHAHTDAQRYLKRLLLDHENLEVLLQ